MYLVGGHWTGVDGMDKGGMGWDGVVRVDIGLPKHKLESPIQDITSTYTVK